MLLYCRLAGLTCGSLLVTVAFGAAKQSDPKITMTMEASSAAAALRQLGRAAHVRLLTSPQTANDVISFKFNDVPLSEAMKRIAAVVNGTWKVEDGSQRLIRTAAQQQSESQKEFDETVGIIRKGIQKKKDEQKKMPGWSADEAEALAIRVQALIKSYDPQSKSGDWYQKGNEYSAQTPIGRALVKVVAALDPAELASLPGYMKTVWSSNPTPTQRPLSNEISGIADEFVKAQTDWAAAIDKHQIKAPSIGRGGTAYVGGLGLFQDDAGGKASVILLSVTRQAPEYGYYCILTAYGPRGKQIAQANTILSYSDDEHKSALLSPAAVGEEKVKLDDDALALIANRDKSPGRAKKVAGGLIGRLLRPEQFDPLSIFLSPKLIQAATIKKVNMVAHLSDNMLMPDVYLSTKETPVDEFLQKDVRVGASVDLENGWLTITPKRPSERRLRQADRAVLGKYLRRLSTGRPLSIDELATFVEPLPDTNDNSMPDGLCGFLRRDIYEQYDEDMLRLYGLLTPEQKSRMAGDGLPFGTLSEKELEYVGRMVYRTVTQVGYMPQKAPQGQQAQPEEELFKSDLMREPTECLPAGVPPDGILTESVTNTSAVYLLYADPDVDVSGKRGSTWDARQLASLKYMQDRPEIFLHAIDDSNKFNFDRLMFGRQVSMNFTFQFTPKVGMTQDLSGTNLDDFKPATINDLPDDFKKQFQDAYKHYAKIYANAKPGDPYGTGSAPPP